MATKKTTVDLLEVFFFPDIPFQPYPVHSISENGNVFNLKNIIFANNGKSKKKYTRNKQLLGKRSQQARMFDFLINIGYWNPLECIREFPVIIENSKRISTGQPSFYLLDYYFPELSLAVELDSDYHKDSLDKVRDEYLERWLGIKTFRIRKLEESLQQVREFPRLIELVKSIVPVPNPKPLDFLGDLRKLKQERESSGIPSGFWKIEE